MARKTPTGDEAAAVAAAIARFEAELAGAPVAAPATTSPWQQAALAEGVGAKESHTQEQPGGDARWLS